MEQSQKGKKRRSKPGRFKLLNRRAELWKKDPFCRACRMPIIDVRLLRKMGVTIVGSTTGPIVRWVDQEGRQYEGLVATIHHIESLEYHRLNGKKDPHRRSNLLLLCRPCHEKIEQAFGSGKAVTPPNKPR